MSTKDAPALFKARVNLVLVPVIVRDAKGQTVGTFAKENFQLFDKGKPQEISRFSVEKSGTKSVREAQTVDAIPGEAPTAAPPDIPERFIAYLFDDIHLNFGDLVRTRDAAGRQISDMALTDRSAIFTTSGQGNLDFTDNREKLREALLGLRTRPISGIAAIAQCPEISHYMADMIMNKNDITALQVGTQEEMICDPMMNPQQALFTLQSQASQILGPAEQETRVSLSVLRDLVRRVSAMPGQRMIIMASPGFITPQNLEEKSEILDKAIRANVIISALDARGLWVDTIIGDISQPSRSASSPSFMTLKNQYDHASAVAQSDVLAEMAYGTGGSFYQNSNDLDAGFKQLAVAPEYYYVLGFSPQNLKLDGSFHSLKVNLKTLPGGNMALQARKGYYAPKKLSTAEETAKEEIEEAVFSREEMGELPVELHTQYFKSSDKDATITVLCRLDPKRMQFRKTDGRNINIITIISAVFDRDGKFITGNQKTVDLKLKDETLAKLSAAGTMGLKSTFAVPPATYMVRLVVRDSEGQLMSALSSAVAIQ